MSSKAEAWFVEATHIILNSLGLDPQMREVTRPRGLPQIIQTITPDEEGIKRTLYVSMVESRVESAEDMALWRGVVIQGIAELPNVLFGENACVKSFGDYDITFDELIQRLSATDFLNEIQETLLEISGVSASFLLSQIDILVPFEDEYDEEDEDADENGFDFDWDDEGEQDDEDDEDDED